MSIWLPNSSALLCSPRAIWSDFVFRQCLPSGGWVACFKVKWLKLFLMSLRGEGREGGSGPLYWLNEDSRITVVFILQTVRSQGTAWWGDKQWLLLVLCERAYGNSASVSTVISWMYVPCFWYSLVLPFQELSFLPSHGVLSPLLSLTPVLQRDGLSSLPFPTIHSPLRKKLVF